MSEIKLDIGCGSVETTRKGFQGVDFYADNPDAIKAKMWDLPFKNGEVDFIYSGQALEHVGKFRVLQTLNEWKRVLKIGGHLEMHVPDLEWACMWWLMHQSTSWDMDIIYGTQLHDGEFHKTGFSMKILHDYLEIVGGFDIHSMEYQGGEATLKLDADGGGGVEQHVEQKIIVVKATRKEEEIGEE